MFFGFVLTCGLSMDQAASAAAVEHERADAPARMAGCSTLDGRWLLSDAGAPSGGVVTEMEIQTDASGHLRLRGPDWSGIGELNRTAGQYRWRFTDGRIGSTSFTLRADCTLFGMVRGSGIHWNYVARRRR